MRISMTRARKTDSQYHWPVSEEHCHLVDLTTNNIYQIPRVGFGLKLRLAQEWGDLRDLENREALRFRIVVGCDHHLQVRRRSIEGARSHCQPVRRCSREVVRCRQSQLDCFESQPGVHFELHSLILGQFSHFDPGDWSQWMASWLRMTSKMLSQHRDYRP